MARTSFESLFSEQWQVSVTACCNSLERNDLRRVTLIRTLDDAQDQFPAPKSSSLQPVALQEFAMLSRGLEHLRKFAYFISEEANPKIEPSPLWGSVGLIVKLTQDHEGLASRIPRMLRDVCHRIEILNKYCDDSSTILLETKEACFDVALVLLPFLFAVIKFTREDREYSSSDNKIWQPLEKQFMTLQQDIDEAVSRLTKLFQISWRSGSSDQSSMSQLQSGFAASRISSWLPGEERTSLPCAIFPTSRTARIFDRAEVILEMHEYFAKPFPDSDNSFRSLALHGLGGVGKSSVALKFAESLLRRDQVDAMFWVSSEKEITIKQSFTDIAMRLKLPGADPKDHDENRTMVLDWLQQTKVRWFLVYDNVESLDLLLTYWPSTTRGQALITTRNRNFAFTPADGGLEIGTWDPDMGSQFLLHLLSTDIHQSLTSKEAISAHELSSTLSGHALAISHMAGLIHRRSLSISEFLGIYKKMPSKVHGISGNSSINALWDYSFRSLGEQSKAILGVMSFLAPDSISQTLFENMDEEALPDSLKFCADPFAFSEVTENLLTLALIKRDREQRVYSVHRLVQTSFKYFLTPEQRQQSFYDAAALVAHVFPKRSPKYPYMYLHWKACSLYLQHVLSLRDCFREESTASKAFAAPALLCLMNTDCQRYLLEVNSFDDNLSLFEVNAMAMDRMPKQTHTIEVNLRGVLHSHRGQALARIGKAEEAVKNLKTAYDILITDDPYNPCNNAWAAENYANGLATANYFDEAVKWQEKGREHWLEYSREHSADKTEWPVVLKKSMGTTLLWAGQRGRAREVLIAAFKQNESIEPYNLVMAAFLNYEIGTLERFERNFELAETHYMEAQNKWLMGDNLRSDPLMGAIMYRLGCVALDQGKVESAIKHLRDSEVATSRHKVRMVAEHARTLFKLSEALIQEPRSEDEAVTCRDEAEHLLRSLDPTTTDSGREKAYDQQVCILWR